VEAVVPAQRDIETLRLQIGLSTVEMLLRFVCLEIARDPASRDRLESYLRWMVDAAGTIPLSGVSAEQADLLTAEIRERAEHLYELIARDLPGTPV
jgi:hypothetical protein